MSVISEGTQQRRQEVLAHHFSRRQQTRIHFPPFTCSLKIHFPAIGCQLGLLPGHLAMHIHSCLLREHYLDLSWIVTLLADLEQRMEVVALCLAPLTQVE